MRLGTRAMRIGDARLLDRLVRGRAWIAIMAIGLIGIVFMQVSLLKLNAGISRAVTAADTLDRQNSSLREEISKLDSGERVQDAAAKLGMVTPAAGDVHYLNGAEASGARAAAAIKPPAAVAPAAATVAPAATQQAATATTATQQPATAATQQQTAATAAAQQPATTTGTGTPSGAAAATGGPAASTQSPPAQGGGAAPVATTSPAPQSTAPPATGQAVAGGASAPQGQG
jgi:cell division protein FtsL